jgi:hypothetical protein
MTAAVIRRQEPDMSVSSIITHPNRVHRVRSVTSAKLRLTVQSVERRLAHFHNWVRQNTDRRAVAA